MVKRGEKEWEEFLEKRKAERQAEVSSLAKSTEIKEAAKIVEKTLKDRLPAQQDDFRKTEEKLEGLTAGYIAKDKETGETFILKHFYKEPQSENQKVKDRKEGVRELIGSTMYQLLLYNRAPKEALVLPDQENQNALYVRSKFFTDAVTLDAFFISSRPLLRQLEGFEKCIAACHLLGEVDYHTNNLMVQVGKTVVKIDHGNSFFVTTRNFGEVCEHMLYFYPGVITDGTLPFSITKYSKALNQMLEQYNQEQMEAVIDQKLEELKQAGLDAKGIKENCSDFECLKKLYKDRVKENIASMREIAKSAEIVSSFGDASMEFMNGGWLEAFKGKSSITDLVAYAVHHNITIGGKNALELAAHHNIKIDGQNAFEWAYENNYPIFPEISKAGAKLKNLANMYEKDSEKFNALTSPNAIKTYQAGVTFDQLAQYDADKIRALTSDDAIKAGKAGVTFDQLAQYDASKIRALTSPNAIKTCKARVKFDQLAQYDADKIRALTSDDAIKADKAGVTFDQLAKYDADKIRALTSFDIQATYDAGVKFDQLAKYDADKIKALTSFDTGKIYRIGIKFDELAKCSTDKIRALTSDDAIEAYKAGAKFYQLATMYEINKNKFEALTSPDAIRIYRTGGKFEVQEKGYDRSKNNLPEVSPHTQRLAAQRKQSFSSRSL